MLTNSTGNGPENGKWQRLARISAYLMGAGFQMAVIVLLFTLAGHWIDKKIEAGGLITVLGGVIGFGASLYTVLRTFKRLQTYLEEDERG